MFFDPLYWLVIGAGMALSLWAQARVKGTFAKYSRLSTRSSPKTTFTTCGSSPSAVR
jgi:Zn-dependent membrane protease YugP